MKKILIYLALVFVYFGCSTAPKTTLSASDVGIWSGRILMTNTLTHQKKWASVHWASDSANSRMRIDVSAVFDVPLATYLQNEQGAHLWLFNQKQYYHSQDGERLFQKLTKLSVDPKIFYDLLAIPQPLASPWACQSEDMKLKCRSVQDKMKMAVDFSRKNQRVIRINKGQEDFRLKLSKSKVQLNDKMFQRLPTSQFKTIQF